MDEKIARFVGTDEMGNGIYDVSPPIGGEGRVVAVSMAQDYKGQVGFYPVGSSSYVDWWDGGPSVRYALEAQGYRIVGAGRMSASDMVREFHTVFGHPVADAPRLIANERAWLRYDLISEELSELYDAILTGDLVAITDALTDLEYVIRGAALEWGIPLDDSLREVHRSNMTKLGADGKPIYRESDNKVLKGPNFEEPDLTGVLVNAGWELD